MNYEQMTQLALRGVVRDAIRRVIREDGLPGAHHFYITFLTRYPGTEIDAQLAAKYPEEITIVVEHQFWDLTANADSFEVTLKFGGIPKYLKVPYTAITRFHDPSVGFALQFDPPKEMEQDMTPTLTAIDSAANAELETKSVTQTESKAKKGDSKKGLPKPKAKKGLPVPEDAAAKAEAAKEGENVVSLDAFRKK